MRKGIGFEVKGFRFTYYPTATLLTTLAAWAFVFVAANL